jgi:putative transposase
MPRIARGLVGGFPYHVLNRGNAGQRVFQKSRDYAAFTAQLREAKERFPVRILGYCLMPNHFHLVVEPKEGPELSSYVQWLLTCHVRRYHRHHGTQGHVWQGRFKSFLVAQDEYLLAVLKYVETNPVRAGLARTAADWQWSSFRERFVESAGFLVDAPIVELPGNWAAFLNDGFLGTQLEQIRTSVRRQSPYGSPDWRDCMAGRLGLESTLRPRGRPRTQH